MLPFRIQEKGMVSLKNLKSVLSEMPFNISNEKELNLLTEYLIDDEDAEEKVTDESQQSVMIVKSIFSKLLGNYESKSKAEFDDCNKHISDVRSMELIFRKWI